MSQPTVVKHIPKEYTEYFVQYHKENKHNYDAFDWEEDELFLRAWGLTEKSKISGHVVATNNYENSKVNLLVKKVLDLFNVNDYMEFEAFIKTCYLPITLHVDANRYLGPTTSHNEWDGEELDLRPDGSDAKPGISIIIPLTFNENIHTIIFKNMVEDNEYVREFLEDIAGIGDRKTYHPTYDHNLDYRDYIPNIWNYQMVAFHDDPQNNKYARGDKVLDYLEVDEIIIWEENVAYVFDKQKMHMSNNFKKFGIESKDFLLIHTH